LKPKSSAGGISYIAGKSEYLQVLAIVKILKCGQSAGKTTVSNGGNYEKKKKSTK